MIEQPFESTTELLLALGGILLLGLLTSAIGRRTLLPRVTLLLIFGVIIGKDMLDIVPTIISDRFDIIANMALLMVGFLLGGKLTIESLKYSTSKILWLSISAAVVTTIVVSLGLITIGVPIELAVILGCLASATDVAAILDITMESSYKGRFKDLLLSIVALDDAWALVIFGIGITVVTSINGNGSEISFLFTILKEIGGAIFLGMVIGFPAAYITGRVKEGQPILTEALGLVFICGGLASWLDVSFLIAAMVMGAVITNTAKHHEYPFHAIEGIESPVLVVFFVLAGATLDISAIKEIGFIGIVYILCRVIGKLIGARLGGEFGKTDKPTKNWMGVAMLPQAGVAIGMALVASNNLPEYSRILLSVAISTTIFFEIVGPIFTRIALNRAQDVK